MAETGKRHDGEFSFESYVERQFQSLHGVLASFIGRLDSMGIDIAGLEADEGVLAQVIPFLIQGNVTLHEEKLNEEAVLNTKVSELQAKETEVAGDEAALATVRQELATAQGELSQVAAVIAKLNPLVEEAQKVLPGPSGGTPEGGTTGEGPSTPAAPTQPVYTAALSEGQVSDPRFTPSGFQTPASPGPAEPLLYFSEDAPNQTLTASGGAVAGYTQYTGATEAVPTA